MPSRPSRLLPPAPPTPSPRAGARALAVAAAIAAAAALSLGACGSDDGATTTTTTATTTSQGGSGAGTNVGGSASTNVGGAGGQGGCGNGIIDLGEGCDDGNQEDGDGCSADCTLPACGDGVVEPGEVCWGAAPTEIVVAGADDVLALEVVDCDGDGDRDIVFLTTPEGAGAGRVVVYVNNGLGNFNAGPSVNVGTGTVRAMTSGALDATAGVDLAVSSGPNPGNGQYAVQRLSGDGACGFTPVASRSVNGPPVAIAAVAIDGDGVDDLAFLLDEAPFRLGLDRSTATPAYIEVSLSSEPGTALRAGLLDGDAQFDLAHPDPDGGRVNVHLATTGDTFLGATPTEDTGLAPLDVALGDLDGDLDVDMVSANAFDDTVSFLENSGTGDFFLGQADVSVSLDGAAVVAEYPVLVRLTDIDADGDLDVVTLNAGDIFSANTPTPSLSVLLNNGLGALSMATTAASPLVEASFPRPIPGGLPQGFDVVDLDGDGAPDAVWIMRGTAQVDPKVVLLFARP